MGSQRGKGIADRTESRQQGMQPMALRGEPQNSVRLKITLWESDTIASPGGTAVAEPGPLRAGRLCAGVWTSSGR